MNDETIELESEGELWSLINKKFNHILIHKFNPNETLEWWKSNIKINQDFELKNVSVRNMTFDLQTDLEELEQILKLNTRHLSIYQFDRPIPDTLSIEMLPKETLDKILKQNGLKFKYSIDYEFVIIHEYDEN